MNAPLLEKGSLISLPVNVNWFTSLFKKIFIFIWLYWVLVAVLGSLIFVAGFSIFRCDM